MDSPDITSHYSPEQAPLLPGRIPEPLPNALLWKQAGASLCKLIAAIPSPGVLCRHVLVGLGLGFLGVAAFTLALPFLACLPYLVR